MNRSTIARLLTSAVFIIVVMVLLFTLMPPARPAASQAGIAAAVAGDRLYVAVADAGEGALVPRLRLLVGRPSPDASGPAAPLTWEQVPHQEGRLAGLAGGPTSLILMGPSTAERYTDLSASKREPLSGDPELFRIDGRHLLAGVRFRELDDPWVAEVLPGPGKALVAILRTTSALRLYARGAPEQDWLPLGPWIRLDPDKGPVRDARVQVVYEPLPGRAADNAPADNAPARDTPAAPVRLGFRLKAADVLYRAGAEFDLYWAHVEGDAVTQNGRIATACQAYDLARTAAGVEAVLVAKRASGQAALSLTTLTPDTDPAHVTLRDPTFQGDGPAVLPGDVSIASYRGLVHLFLLQPAGVHHAVRAPGAAAFSALQPLQALERGRAPGSYWMLVGVMFLLTVTVLIMLVVRQRRRGEPAGIPGVTSKHYPARGRGVRRGAFLDEPASVSDERQEPESGAHAAVGPDDDDDARMNDGPAAAAASERPRSDAERTDDDEPLADREDNPDQDAADQDAEHQELPALPTETPRKEAHPSDDYDPFDWRQVEERLGFLPAGLFLRAMSAGIDFLVLLIPVALTADGAGIRLNDYNPLDIFSGGGPDTLSAFVVLALWHFAYGTVSEYSWGRTLGKRLFRLEVRSDSLGPASFAQCAVRNALRLVDYYLFLIVLFSARGQRLGDLLAHTVVRREPPEGDGIV